MKSRLIVSHKKTSIIKKKNNRKLSKLFDFINFLMKKFVYSIYITTL